MITMFYVVYVRDFVEDKSKLPEKFGFIKSRHKDWFAADKAAKSCRGTQVFEWSSEEKFEVEGIYVDKAYDSMIEFHRKNQIYKCAEVMEKLLDGCDPIIVSRSLYPADQFNCDMEFDAWMAEFSPEAQKLIDERKGRKQKRAEELAKRKSIVKSFKNALEAVCYSFPAVKGIQANKEFYIAQVPFKYLVKLFTFSDETLPPELRAQRRVNTKHGEEIAQYVVNNRDDYVLPSLTVSVNAAMTFEALGEEESCLGNLKIPVDATCLINDGQHRKYGAEIFIGLDETLKDETVPVTFFYDQGLERSMQIFADLNANLSKPSAAINALYDKRNEFNGFVLDALKVHELDRLVDKEHTTIGKKSERVWSLVHWKKFAGILLDTKESSFKLLEDDQVKANLDFFNCIVAELSAKIPLWTKTINGYMSSAELRENSVAGHAVLLESLAMALSCLKDSAADEISDAISKIAELDFSKQASCWQNRCVVADRMAKSVDNVKLTAAFLRKTAGLELSETMVEAENRHKI